MESTESTRVHSTQSGKVVIKACSRIGARRCRSVHSTAVNYTSRSVAWANLILCSASGRCRLAWCLLFSIIRLLLFYRLIDSQILGSILIRTVSETVPHTCTASTSNTHLFWSTDFASFPVSLILVTVHIEWFPVKILIFNLTRFSVL